LLYDRFDIYAFPLEGGTAERLTHGAESSISHRRERVAADPDDDRYVDLEDGFYVSLYGEVTKKSGYGHYSKAAGAQHLIWKDARLGRLSRAEDADVMVFSEERFDDSPDYFVADAMLKNPKAFTSTNEFAEEFAWGTAELVDYESADGTPLQGALFYPADYDPTKTYPMVVYIYELRSQSLHQYARPSETNPYSPAVFTQEGYFVFQPDIVYRAQNPGLSAVDCVVPAVREVLATKQVDPERVGLFGHSWGAYQTAFIVTQTDIFAAGVAGAPLTNMMSMSMSIYWNSGQTDAWIFHESQGRMDRPFWRDVDTYIANSPIFSIENLNTPLLVTFGDEDGAVDWQQGIEMYNAARLAQRPYVMLVYPGENHGLRVEENQVDYHHRVREWFRTHVKGEEAPAWIAEGVSWLDQKEALEAIEKKK
ncbi:MAG: prolyl oligopeptidase family serine peptidase, partial [Planctomycetota bacterium]